MKKPLNLVLVVFDTARRDRFSCYGYPRATTPAADALAREALLFERMITPAPWTVPSHASLFTGLYPREHGADNPMPLLRTSLPTLAAHLGAHGYATACVTNNPLVSGETGLAGGFAEVRLRPGLNGQARWSGRLRFALGLADSGAAATNRLLADLLPRLPHPFFLFVNYLECHWNYAPPRRFERRFAPRHSWLQSIRRRVRTRDRVMWEAIAEADADTLALYSDLYDAELATVDARFGNLLDLLRRTRRWEETVLVLTSDHGESLGEEGLASHQGSLRQHLIQVPFLSRLPGRQAARIEGLTQFTDVYAGLCGVLGLPVPAHLEERPFAVDPFTLRPGEPGRPFAFSEWRYWAPEKLVRLRRKARHFDFERIPPGLEAVQDGRYKLLVDGDGRERLFDLARDHDEQRTVDLPEQTNRLQEALLRWRAAAVRGEPSVYTAAEEAAVEDRLRELGYL